MRAGQQLAVFRRTSRALGLGWKYERVGSATVTDTEDRIYMILDFDMKSGDVLVIGGDVPRTKDEEVPPIGK